MICCSTYLFIDWLTPFFLTLTQGHFFSFLLEREEGRERNIDMRQISIGCLPYIPRLGIVGTWIGDITPGGLCVPGDRMCPEQGLNPQPMYVSWVGIEPTAFWLLDDAPTNEPHRPGLLVDSCMCPGRGSNPQP